MLIMFVKNVSKCLLCHNVISTAQQRAALLLEKIFLAYPSELKVEGLHNFEQEVLVCGICFNSVRQVLLAFSACFSIQGLPAD